MRWGYVVLLFQVLVTLTIGMVFLAEVRSLDFQRIAEYQIEIGEDSPSEGSFREYVDLKHRFSIASYILLFASTIELIVVIRLMMK